MSDKVATKKYFIANVAYGAHYTDLFLENYLKSALDETNLPALKGEGYEVTFLIYTDSETKLRILTHKNFAKLEKCCAVVVKELSEIRGSKFPHRYAILHGAFLDSMTEAHAAGALYTPHVADHVVARGFYSSILKRIDEGFDSVLVLPPRCMAETVSPFLREQERAFEAKDLFRICFAQLHHLWRDSYWRSERFTSIPYVMLWGSPQGLTVRTFCLSPLLFKVNKNHLASTRDIDGEIPSLCEKPFIATNWSDAPVVGVEPELCFAGFFGASPPQVETIKEWSAQAVHPSQKAWLKFRLYFPDKETCGVSAEQLSEAAQIAKELLT